MELLGRFVLSTGVGTVAAVSRGYVIVLLWRWFVMPQFHLAALPWTVAYGLTLLCHLLVPTPKTEHEDKSYMASMASSTVSGVLAPWLICGMAWVIK
jgi:hypothetical protein